MIAKNNKFISKDGRISLINVTEASGKVEATFAMEQESFREKIRDRKELLLADPSLMADIEKVKSTDDIATKVKGLCKTHEIYGPDIKIIEAFAKGMEPEDRYMVKMTIEPDDDDYYYLKMPNNLSTSDINDLFSLLRRFLQTTKNKTTRISPRTNIKPDARILKLHNEGKTPTEIAKIEKKTLNEIQRRLLRIMANKNRFKKS